ncbi:MAG: thioredoxin-dependent thiol peroxidase [Chloroflexi bacterium]|nr:thioredoxin-dependent thiol peroxidase [Chloroflexota bacterium]
MVSLKPGDLAPDFELPTDAGTPLRLSSLRGHPVTLYFYPRDDTPGCTREACSLRDGFGAFARAGVTVLGVSPDDTDSHTRFSRKYALPFPLLADEGHRVAELYGVWGEKPFMGRKHMGVLRTTFVIDAAGRIARVFENVKPDGHASEILAALGIAA